jgi:hypothetical protein
MRLDPVRFLTFIRLEIQFDIPFREKKKDCTLGFHKLKGVP